MLLFSLHHIIGDAWSLEILVRELGALYAAACRGEAPALPPLAIQYGDYALWQRGWLSGATLERQLAYWRDALAGAPALLELPLDHARPAVKSYRGARVEQRIDATLADRLRALGRQHGATLYMTLLAAFKVLLYRLSGSGDVVVGSPIANRRHSSTEGVIGLFVNTLVLRGRLGAEMPFGAVLRQVQRTALAAYAHQDVPFEALVSELSVERSLSHSPLFQVMFALQTAPEAELRSGRGDGARAGAADAEREVRPLPGDERTGRGAGRGVGVQHRPVRGGDGCADGGAIRDAAGWNGGGRRSGDRSVAAAERGGAVRLERFNATARAYPRDATIGALFADEAAARPGSVALVSGGEVVSYGELEARANRLAQYLCRRLGCAGGRGWPAGGSLERSDRGDAGGAEGGGGVSAAGRERAVGAPGVHAGGCRGGGGAEHDALAAALPAGVAALPAGSAALSPGSARWTNM